jgi:hypothetical protein
MRSCTVVKLDEENSKIGQFRSGNWFLAQPKSTLSCAVKTPAEKSVINMILLLISVSDWPIIMIGPGGLLLVIPHLFAVPVSVL